MRSSPTSARRVAAVRATALDYLCNSPPRPRNPRAVYEWAEHDRPEAGRSTASAVSADANGGEGPDLVLGQGDVHRVALDPGDGPDRDGDLLPPPEVAALE